MKDLFKQFIRAEHTIMATDSNIADVLRVLDRHEASHNIDVMFCDGHGLGANRWYVDFMATGRQMKAIVPELLKKADKEIIIVKNKT